MSRLQLLEFEDQPWFPSLIRNFGTDSLQFLSNKTKMYDPIIPMLEKGVNAAKTENIVDLGSGGGGGMIWINEKLRESHPLLDIHLTDLYPNKDAFQYTVSTADNFHFHDTPIDARGVPEKLQGLRTQFLSFHHFNPDDARSILQNAVENKQPILIVEAQERSVPSILAMIFSHLTLWLATPFIRPFKWTRLLFTYLIPITPLVVIWDGIVSALRTYSVTELKSLVEKVDNSNTYTRQIEKVKGGPGILIYLYGEVTN